MGLSDILGKKLQQNYGGGYSAPTSTAGMGGPGNPSAYRGLSGLTGGDGSGGSYGPVGLSQLGSNGGGPSVSQLQANETNKKQPGVMSRIFDILSRPEYAIAAAMKDSALDPNRDPNTGGRLAGTTGVSKGHFDAGGILKGLSQGIQGKDKTTVAALYNDPASPTMTQKDAQGKVTHKGMPGGVVSRTAAGIFQGAMFDPTTYATLGTNKIVEPLKIAGDLEKAKLAAQSVKDASLATRIAGGVDKGANVLSKVGDVGKARTFATAVAKSGRTAALTDEVTKAGKLGKGIKVGDSLSKLPTDAKALQLKFAGVPILSSKKAYTAGRILTDPLRYSGPAQTLADAFKAGHTLPAGVHDLMRGSAGRGATQAFDTVRSKGQEIKDLYKSLGITKAGDHELYQAIQRGQAIETLPKELQPAFSYYKEELAKLAKSSGKAGGDLKFADHAAYKGADVARGGYDKASVQLAHMLDRSVKTQAYADFMKQIGQRFPENSEELKNAIQKSKDLFGTTGSNGAALSFYMDKAIQPWKRWVTAYRPGFQIKHQLGDLLDANFAGTDVTRFGDSAKVLAKGTDHVDEVAKSIAVGGSRISPAEADSLYRHNGLERSFINTDIAGETQRGVAHAVTQFSAHREKYTRMATFLHYVDKHMKEGLSLEQAGEKAGAAVRKYHGDFSDLTSFERSLKRVIPFYGYTKKELPLLIEQLVTNPHKITQVGRMEKFATSLAGVQPDPNNPFPGIDQVVPSWMSQHGIITTGPNRALTPNLSVDHLSWLSPMDAVKQIQGMVTPLAKVPMELARGKTFEGIPIRRAGSKGRGQFGEDVPGESNLSADMRYLANYLPYGSFANQSKTSTTDKLISLMTGMGEHTVKGKASGKGGKWAG